MAVGPLRPGACYNMCKLMLLLLPQRAAIKEALLVSMLHVIRCQDGKHNGVILFASGVAAAMPLAMRPERIATAFL